MDERDAINELNRRQERARAIEDKRDAATKPVSGAIEQRLVQLINRFEQATDPKQKKLRLATFIKERVRCEHFHPVLAQVAAERVVYDGFPVAELYRVLDQLDAADTKGNVLPWIAGKGGGRGGWFVGIFNLRLRERGFSLLKAKKET